MSVGLVVGNRYELTARIGRGGFGSVWQARDATLRRDVAVKLLEVAPEDGDIVARFWREAQAVASLNHPNIVIAHDFGVVDNSAYLVMELITGGSLADELATRRMAGAPPLDVRRVVALGSQIAAGLAAAHAAGLVHRDLKPANIMLVRATGAVKIVDFGIARISDLSRLTKPGGYLGTLPYASPEQIGDGTVDGRSDLYALGCLLYELLTDHSPYVAESPAQWIAAHQSVAPTPIRTYRPDLPPDLESLVHALLAKDPAHRPPDADTVRTRLERVPPGVPVARGVPVPRPTLIDSRPLGAPGAPLPLPARGQTPPPGAVAMPVNPVKQTPPGGVPMPANAWKQTPPPGAAAMPYYAWKQVQTPQGWMAVPHLIMPSSAPRRPATVTAAGRLLMALAIACGIEALVVVAATIRVGKAAQTAFAGIASTAAGGIVGAMMFAAVTFIGAAAITAILGGVTFRGSYAGRIWTWIVAGLCLPIVLGALGSPDVATAAATPTPADALRPRVLDALTQVRTAIPTWYVNLTKLFDVFAVLALILVIVLMALPATNAYVRAHRHRGMR